MQDTFKVTPELLCEFFDSLEYETSVQYQWEQFKSSKAPKKDWEIAAFIGDIGLGERLYELCPDGDYRWKGVMDKMPRSAELLISQGCIIHSVRRLSDGEVFSVGDRIKTETYHQCVIEGFSINNDTLAIHHSKNTLFITWGNAAYFNLIQKLSQTILMTVDGVEIFPGDKCSFVFDDDWTGYLDADYDFWKPRFDNAWQGYRAFSTREAAEDYILNHKPVLSLNDVREAMPRYMSPGEVKAVTDKLTVLVKEKINQ